MNFQIIPVFVAILTYFFTRMTTSQTSAVFAPVYGVSLIDPSVTAHALLSKHGIQQMIPIFNNPAYIVIAVCAVFLLLTLGWQTVGATYVLRGMVRHDPVFVFSDYFYGIKRNFKEGFVYGLIDSLIIVVLLVDFLFFYARTGTSMGNNLMFWTVTALIVLYLLMRPYIYMMLITFNMKLSKILKNALIFAILGIKRNLLAIVGILLVAFLNLALVMISPAAIMQVSLILPLLYFCAFAGFTTNYAVYPIIDRYMIAPCREESESADPRDDIYDV
jgi:uncharacterized membrane protein YesL